jgi:hypothetical protein
MKESTVNISKCLNIKQKVNCDSVTFKLDTLPHLFKFYDFVLKQFSNSAKRGFTDSSGFGEGGNFLNWFYIEQNNTQPIRKTFLYRDISNLLNITPFLQAYKAFLLFQFYGRTHEDISPGQQWTLDAFETIYGTREFTPEDIERKFEELISEDWSEWQSESRKEPIDSVAPAPEESSESQESDVSSDSDSPREQMFTTITLSALAVLIVVLLSVSVYKRKRR